LSRAGYVFHQCFMLSYFYFCDTVSSETPISALTTVDAKIFRHEFITIFRLSETTTLHPSDISIIELIKDYHLRYEEENETVFLAKELMGHMQKMTEKPRILRSRLGRYRYGMHLEFVPHIWKNINECRSHR
jgi:hypothetical protein